MNSKKLDLQLENESLKREFKMRNLKLSLVWDPTPEDIELENRQLSHLLDWVKKYEACHNRKKMEAEGYLYPPISFDIDPDSDWLRFEHWMAGKAIRGKLRDLVSRRMIIKSPDLLDDTVIETETEKLIHVLENFHIEVDFKDELPSRLLYESLMDMLEEEFDLIAHGWWHLDGCDGYCPGCFRRPWCKSGGELCWDEDEKAGCMKIPERVKKYVSPSPVSLRILQQYKGKYDNLI